ncbi:hypothetical protein KUCAC02_017766 [Chaenocephalus aceratus]|uniref:Uncharacterized protein n=1 Tax=Chaenocephalus aceratus TaxID=36190 RepID=A0ACB9W3L6_CHAAC|nr:hypothetical protein KUCAC02_017766 [Chaenocephalus aceratus]
MVDLSRVLSTGMIANLSSPRNQKEITGPPEDLGGSRSPLLIKIHGVLMLTVWMWMVSTAIFIARHYKNVWPEKTLLGQSFGFSFIEP